MCVCLYLSINIWLRAEKVPWGKICDSYSPHTYLLFLQSLCIIFASGHVVIVGFYYLFGKFLCTAKVEAFESTTLQGDYIIVA